jgi:hypothetical protein
MNDNPPRITCRGCGRSDGGHPKHCPRYRAPTSPLEDAIRKAREAAENAVAVMRDCKVDGMLDLETVVAELQHLEYRAKEISGRQSGN